MQTFKLSESTAARRRVFLHLVDVTDGFTPETGEASGQPQISKNGGAFASTSATLTAVANGLYYVELTTGELDTLGLIAVRYKSANTREFQTLGQVVAFDPFDAAGLGLSRLDAAITTRSTVTTAEVNTEVDNALNTAIPGSPTANSINERLATMDDAYTAARAALLDALDADISTRATPADVAAEIADALGVDTIAELSAAAPAATPTIKTALALLYMAVRNKRTITDALLQYHNDAGSAICKGVLSDDGTTFEQAELAAP